MMIPRDADTSRWRALRPDASGPVTCTVCGCRLTDAPGLVGNAWRHFQTSPDTDARGDRPRCLEDLHDRSGYPMSGREAGRLITFRETSGSDEPLLDAGRALVDAEEDAA